MPQSLVKSLVHIVFSTKYRARLIPTEIESDLFKHFSRIAENHACKLIIAGGSDDHVHILVSMGKNTLIPDLVGALKRNTSGWMKTQGPSLHDFYWQLGYGAFSIGQSQVGAVSDYIRNQRKHHQRIDFQSEYRDLLRLYGMDFDERYVWD